MGKGVVEKMSWIGVTETVRCAASWRRCRGKHGRHGKVVMECVMETARRAASWKGVTQSDTCGVSRNSRHGMRNGKHQRSQNVALSECHGKVVVDSVMESNTCATSWRGVTESNICLASRKRCHGKQHGNSKVRSVMERRHGKRYWWSVMEKPSWNASRKLRGVQRHGKVLCKAILVERHGIVVTECVTESISDHRM